MLTHGAQTLHTVRSVHVCEEGAGMFAVPILTFHSPGLTYPSNRHHVIVHVEIQG